MNRILALACCSALLAACGGGSDAPPPPPLPNPGEPNETFETATPISIGTPVVATISEQLEPDYYRFTVPTGGATVRFQTFDAGGTACDPVNGGVDPRIDVFDGARGPLGFDDDGGLPPWCEDLTLTLAEGTNYVLVSGWNPTPFVYTLKLTAP